MPKQDYAYYKALLKGRQMPLAYVDLDLFDQNVKSIVLKAGSKKIRIATKSVRVPELIKRILDSSDVYQGLMCYSPREMVYWSQQGFDDLLMGYPIWNEADILPICEEVKKGKQLVLMIDSVDHIKHLQSIGEKQGLSIPVCLDLDMSSDFPGLHFGVWRSSIRKASDAKPVIDAILKSPNVKLDGLMGYEAQIAGLGDNVKGQGPKNAVVKILKSRSVKEIAKRRAEVVKMIADAGIELRFVNGGGTGSLDTTTTEEAVTEVTVGSGFFAPALFDHYEKFKYLPAAAYAIEVVRSPKPGTYTCLGGGFIASGEIGKLKEPVILFPKDGKLTDQEGVGEVQTPVLYDGKLELGDPVILRHSKAGELCEHFTSVLLIQDGKVVGEAKTNRGLGYSFL
ncbi:MAG: D-serine deaminase-like pyridoxal phosphate-dependent protein [Granulosicoccus sp.]|jgi:D-serine deaminase-like pyridoxal phosphate-dependent protein